MIRLGSRCSLLTMVLDSPSKIPLMIVLNFPYDKRLILHLPRPELDGIFQDFEKVLDDDDDVDEPPCLNGEKSSIGLGLAVAARFVRLNDGKIVINTEPGHGTTVTVSIPFRKPEGGHQFTSRTPHQDASAPAISTKTPESENCFQCDTPERFQVPPPTPLKDPFLTSTTEIIKSPTSIPTPSTCSHSSPSPSQSLSTKSVTTNPDYQLQYPFPIMELPPQPEIRNLNVLVAEDNPLNSRLLEERLRKRGHVVTVKINGQACAEAVMATPDGFDIVLMDIQVRLVPSTFIPSHPFVFHPSPLLLTHPNSPPHRCPSSTASPPQPSSAPS